MSSSDAINGIVDAILTRITDNLALLGLDSVVETDEEPRYITPPQAYVIPFVEGRDTIKILSGGEEHKYPVNIVGFYKYTSIQTGLRIVRSYGLGTLDLFTRENSTISTGVYGAAVSDASLEVGYWRNGDYIMHYWSLQLQIHQIV